MAGTGGRVTDGGGGSTRRGGSGRTGSGFSCSGSGSDARSRIALRGMSRACRTMSPGDDAGPCRAGVKAKRTTRCSMTDTAIPIATERSLMCAEKCMATFMFQRAGRCR